MRREVIVMKPAIAIAGILIVAFGIIVEIIGVFNATDALQHNAYGWTGGLVVLLGTFIIQRSAKKPLVKTNNS